MIGKITILIFVTILISPMVKGPEVGKFFWKPRIQVLFNATKDVVIQGPKDNKYKVMINGYDTARAMMSIIVGIYDAKRLEHLSPLSAAYYTNVFRWALRYFDTLPKFLTQRGGHYVETHKVWKNRYTHMGDFLPSWIKRLIFFVDKDEWAREEKQYDKYKKYVEPAMGKHYHFKTSTQETEPTVFDWDASDLSFNKKGP